MVTLVSPDAAAPPSPTSEAATARYSAVAIVLHWLIAAAILLEIGLGWGMVALPAAQRFVPFQLHKSIGITILLLSVARLGWRVVARPPRPPAHLADWERHLAAAAHGLLYVLMIGLPLTGWLAVSSSALAVPTFLYGLVPWPGVPGIAGLAAGPKAGVHTVATTGHVLAVYCLCAVLALHIAGALKHQFVDRHPDLARMAPVRTAALPVVAIGTLAALAVLVAIGNRILAAPSAGASPAVTDRPPVRPATAGPAPVRPTPAPSPSARPAQIIAPEPTEAAPREWIVARAGSSLRFTTHWSGGAVDGSFGSWNADIRFDPAALDGSSVKATIDLASVRTGVDETEGALPGDDFFAASRFPRATFIATRFSRLGGDRYEARGTLSLRGTSRPVRLPFTLKIDGARATMRGSLSIDRTAFGVGQGEWAATDAIPAMVRVDIAISATARDPAAAK